VLWVLVARFSSKRLFEHQQLALPEMDEAMRQIARAEVGELALALP
jgi:hypothetical protein